MLKVSRMTLLLVGMSYSATGLADVSQPSIDSVDALPVVTLPIQAMYEDSNLASRWRLSDPVEVPIHSYDWSQPRVNVPFQDSGVLARVSKLRNLSLLTFAEIGRARLFLGVDKNGIVGLHFRAFNRAGDERYLEVARLSYLNDAEPGEDTE